MASGGFACCDFPRLFVSRLATPLFLLGRAATLLLVRLGNFPLESECGLAQLANHATDLALKSGVVIVEIDARRALPPLLCSHHKRAKRSVSLLNSGHCGVTIGDGIEQTGLINIDRVPVGRPGGHPDTMADRLSSGERHEHSAD